MLSGEHLSNMSRYELQQYAKEMGIKANQSSQKLIDELTQLSSTGEEEQNPVAAADAEMDVTDETLTTNEVQDSLVMFTPEAAPKVEQADAAPVDVSSRRARLRRLWPTMWMRTRKRRRWRRR